MGCMIRRSKPFLINHYIHDPQKSQEEKENYCHQMLLLFLPWRSEVQLLGKYASYIEAFEDHLPQREAMMAYHEKLNAEVQLAAESKEEFEKDTPLSRLGDDPENAFQAHEEVDETVLKDIVDAMQANPQCDLQKNLQSLNDDQRRIFEHITSGIVHQQQHAQQSCDCGKEPKQILKFVSGVGGCGKSYLIHTIKQWMKENIQGEDQVSTAVCAPTGLAALNVGGVTVHRLLMLPVEHGKTADYQALSPEAKIVLRQTLSGLKLLIVDEISMISSLVLTYIHLRLSEITEVDHPFGKINIVLLGDLLQLSPVKGNPPFMPLTRQEIRLRLHSIGGVDLWSLFEYDELTRNQRQVSDLRYANLLSNIRTGIISPDDVSVLQSRIIAAGSPDPVVNAIECFNNLLAKKLHPVCLLQTNDMCRSMNDSMLDMLGMHIIYIKSIDTLDGPLVGEKAKKNAWEALDKLKDKLSLTAGLESELKLSLTAQVMLRRNVDMSLGLVNGVIGKVLHFQFNDITVCKIQVQFENVAEPVWIERVNAKFHLLKKVYVHRLQFPLSLAYGLTVHKSQGMSLDCVVIDIGKGTFAEGMSYVALSRVTSLEGLHLLAFDESKVVVDIRAINAYNDLRLRYRPDLGMLPVGRTRKRRQPASPQVPESISVTETKRPRLVTSGVRKGFDNPDQKTCYANSALQVLLSLPEFVTLASQCNAQSRIISTLKDVITAQERTDSALLSAVPLRYALGGIFSEPQQQDVAEFILELFQQLQNDPPFLNLSALFGFEYVNRKRCLHCGAKSNMGQPENHVDLFRLRFNDERPKGRKFSWTDFFSWRRLEDTNCPICETAMMETKSILLGCQNYLLVAVCRFDANFAKVDYLVSGFTNSHVDIDELSFETVAAIAHHGPVLSEGHYTCYIKNTDCGWTECNDWQITVKNRFIRELKDVYVLFLRKL